MKTKTKHDSEQGPAQTKTLKISSYEKINYAIQH